MSALTISLRTGLTLGTLLLTALAGCSSAAPESTSQTSEPEALTTEAGGAYVTVTRDPRDCIGPRCGGYWIRAVNVCSHDVYVSKLDLSPLVWDGGWDGKERDVVTSARPEDLVLRGRLGEPDPVYGTRALVVNEAYRGMPGVHAAEGNLFFAVTPRTPHVECVTAPCPQWTAHPLNRKAEAANVFDRIDATPAAMPFVDTEWLATRLTDHGGVAAGAFVSGDTFPGGAEQVLSTSQVYVRLPNVDGICPKLPQPACKEDEVMTFTRNADRCLIPDTCVKPGVCAAWVPACADGYVLAKWASGENACPAYACDPAF